MTPEMMIWTLVIGGAFGYFLEASGLASPKKLNAQFSLQDWTVFKVMFLAVVVAAIGIALFVNFGWLHAEALKLPTVFWWSTIAGGALLGAGLAVGGYCPGTSVAGLFSGRIDALFFMVGIVIGTIAFAAMFDWLKPFYMAAKGAEQQTLPSLLGWPVWLVLMLLLVLLVVGFKVGNRCEQANQ